MSPVSPHRPEFEGLMENERKWRKIRFARNLSALIEGTGMTRTQFAEKAEIPFPWLQRATTDGITRLDRRGRAHLGVIARWFGLADAERLWDRDFVAPPPWGTREARAIRLAEDLRRLILERGEDAEPARSIVRLLEAGAGRAQHGAVEPDRRGESRIDPAPTRLERPPSGVESPAAGVPSTGPAGDRKSTMAEEMARWKQEQDTLRAARTSVAGVQDGDAGESTSDSPGLAGSDELAGRLSSLIVPKRPAPFSRSGLAYRRRLEQRCAELIQMSRYAKADPARPGPAPCADCGQPGTTRCPSCGRPLCDRCHAAYPACEACSPAWPESSPGGDPPTVCGYCGREDVASKCDVCGEDLCPRCARRRPRPDGRTCCTDCSASLDLEDGLPDDEEDDF